MCINKKKINNKHFTLLGFGQFGRFSHCYISGNGNAILEMFTFLKSWNFVESIKIQ